MAVNKVVYNTADGTVTLIDLTGDTVTPETLLKGVIAHNAKGEIIVGTLELTSDPSYTNLIPTSIDTDGSIYNGKGFSTGYLSSGAVTANSNRSVTGFMPIGCGSATTARGEVIINFANINVPEGDNYVRVGYYTADKTYIIQQSGSSFKATDDGQASSIYTAEAGMIKTVDVTGYTAYLQKTMGKTPAFFRVSVPGATGINENSIITVNEPIE